MLNIQQRNDIKHAAESRLAVNTGVKSKTVYCMKLKYRKINSENIICKHIMKNTLKDKQYNNFNLQKLKNALN